jgi:nucleotide-binding universal stress UspA family protein
MGVSSIQGGSGMTTIHRVLVATDFSSGARVAVERAVQLAEAHGASLDLLHAFDASAWHGLKGVFDAQRLVMDPPPDVRVHQHLKNQAQSLATTTGLKVEACFGAGDVGQVIAARVREKAVSLVVVGSRSEPELIGLGQRGAEDGSLATLPGAGRTLCQVPSLQQGAYRRGHGRCVPSHH